MSSATNALSNASHQIQVLPIAKPEADGHDQQISPAFVPTTDDSKAISTHDYKEKKRSSSKKNGEQENEEKQTSYFPGILLSHENMKALTEIELDFSEYDKLLSFFKFRYYN